MTIVAANRKWRKYLEADNLSRSATTYDVSLNNESEHFERNIYQISEEERCFTSYPPKINRVAKIVLKKSLGKRRQSTRKLALRLTRSGSNVFHMSVHRYLRKSLGVKPYKRPRKPRLTKKMKENRMKFAVTHKDWTVGDWNRVLWSDESPFKFFQIPNRQNDRVWSKDAASIQPCMKVKFPAKIQVWGMMSHQALSELHIIPQGETVNGDYYRTKILAGTCKDAIHRTAKNGSVLKRSITSEMSGIIFMQTGHLLTLLN
ncbi:hypothetical protein LOD99_12467 [Oopsacas minuta]|uniref:Transposase Tc1-like domain-containing protein n=1 Tax=Oopsacas minuta TaxID=111878 RepID=A0AAV7JGC3_9METZ|nr:hypothetical protein LOD99_12467 [Oopsacas minuta]